MALSTKTLPENPGVNHCDFLTAVGISGNAPFRPWKQ